MHALTLCAGCSRHVRESDPRCPFCDAPRVATASPSLEPAPRALPRALVATLGMTLSVGACQGRPTPPLTPPPPRTEPHPVIAAPYGAPPPPPTDAAPAPPQLSWFITLPDPIPMAARARTPLEIVARNLYDRPLDTHRERLRLRVNGQESASFALSFGNGVMGPDWQTVPPRGTSRDARNVLEALMPTPGEYMLELFLDGQRVAARRVTVTP
ncbi:MAG: hypothetical protein U0325_15935 [Polyangiales bacterium]